MKNISHQAFVDKLKKQLITDTHGPVNDSYNNSSSADVCQEDIMKELERKFDELFGDLDDDD